jgi:hypothetical protein
VASADFNGRRQDAVGERVEGDKDEVGEPFEVHHGGGASPWWRGSAGGESPMTGRSVGR